MAFAKRPQAPRFKAPKGVFVFPKLNKPDTKFKSEGEFAVKVRYNGQDPEVQAFINKLLPIHQQAIVNAEESFKALKIEARKKLGKVSVNDLFTTCYDESENPTGEIEFKFSTPASGKIANGPNAGKMFIKRPTIVDAKGNTLVTGTDFSWANADDVSANLDSSGPAIWGGSEGICAIEVGLGKDGTPGYFIPGTGAAGLSLRLRAVQVTKLVGGSGGGDFGFGQEEGYESDGQVHDSAQTEKTETTDAPFDGGADF